MSYICSMESTFTYYKHLNALDRILVSHRFIDGETYVIRELYPDMNIIYGNFYVNLCLLVDGRWVYSDVVKDQGIPIDNKDFKKIMSIAKPLKFKKVSK